jgi:hypothetical protein
VKDFPEDVVVVMPVFHHVDYRLQQVLSKAGAQVIANYGTSDIALARSYLITQVLKKLPNIKRMVWLDSDIVLTEEQLFRLAEHDEVLVSGVYVQSNGTPCVGTRTVMQLPESGLLEIDWAGFGCVSMAREVAEVICSKLPEVSLFGGVYPAFAHLAMSEDRFVVPFDDPRAKFWLTEDLSFFHRAREAGFTPMLQCDLRVAHVKEFPLPVIPQSVIGKAFMMK